MQKNSNSENVGEIFFVWHKCNTLCYFLDRQPCTVPVCVREFAAISLSFVHLKYGAARLCGPDGS